ncbi:hypothetical protein VQ574_05465 [Stutzerimonas frequens]|uniref:hypothetical protein n=1 Tax=Stutzerimonas frequens TaxID=2968969 RepID=UPI002DBB8052|nr:hypothetical protein [Stutzerimonas frequens]WRW28183.1 hypothetical protein VQ574_05465 [Stutzerimonas frequens]
MINSTDSEKPAHIAGFSFSMPLARLARKQAYFHSLGADADFRTDSDVRSRLFF